MYRYKPIHIEKLNLGNLTTNLQYVYPNASLRPSELRVENISLGQDYSLTNIIPILIYTLLAVIAVFMAYILFTYLRHRHEGLPLFVVARKTSTPLESLTISYSYEGIARILREIFLGIRDKLCKPYCTPREVALKHSASSILQLFAKVYEDVVYGSRKREDAEVIADEVRKHFIEGK